VRGGFWPDEPGLPSPLSRISESTGVSASGLAASQKPFYEGEEMREKALKFLEALGGKENITEIDGCITRMRTTVVDPKKVDDRKLRAAGAIGVLKMGTGIQIVVGTYAELIATEINKIMRES